MRTYLFLAVSALFAVGAVNAQTTHLVDLNFDQLTGGVFVNSGSTGTINDGLPTGNVALSPGVVAQGITLGGASGDEVIAGPSPLSGGQTRTVSVWARTTATTGIVTPMTFGSNGNGSKWDMDIDCDNGGVLELGVGGGRTTGQGPALNDGLWHMMTAVMPMGATNLHATRLFADGTFLYGGTGNTGRLINTGAGNVIVGRSANFPTTIQFFPGDVDDLVIWSEPLSDEQVKSLHDVATDPSLGYAASDFEQLLEVYRQTQPGVMIGARIWARATGLTGPPGLTLLSHGGFELVFDTNGNGVRVVQPAGATTFGTGCSGTGGAVPAISNTGRPVIGTTSSIDLSNGCPGCPAVLLLGPTRIDVPIGFGCTIYPQLLGLSLSATVSGTGLASIPTTIPNDRFLIGANIYAQWAALDPGGASGPGVASSSNGLRLTIGDA